MRVTPPPPLPNPNSSAALEFPSFSQSDMICQTKRSIEDVRKKNARRRGSQKPDPRNFGVAKNVHVSAWGQNVVIMFMETQILEESWTSFRSAFPSSGTCCVQHSPGKLSRDMVYDPWSCWFGPYQADGAPVVRIVTHGSQQELEQNAIAVLSSVESELCVLVKVIAESWGFSICVGDLGPSFSTVVRSNAGAALGMIQRQGLGEGLKHWIASSCAELARAEGRKCRGATLQMSAPCVSAVDV